MAKIIYALSGEGFGHATRSHVIIEKLSKSHDIKILCGGKAYSYLTKFFNNVENISSLRIKYKNNRVSCIGTLFLNYNPLALARHIAAFFKVRKIINRFKPDIIINDFENITDFYSLFSNLPLISINNQHIITNAGHKVPFRYFISYLKSCIVIKLLIPNADYCYITSFFKPELKKTYASKSEYIPLILRNKIKKLKQSYGNYIFVYQTSESNKELFRALKAINRQFIIYGFDAEKKEGNLHFRRFSEKRFYQELANCEAVIMNGGYSLMSEALYLKKPIYSEPVRGQFEQILNAIYLQRYGFGMFAERCNKQNIQLFLSRLDEYKKNLKKRDNKKIGKEFDEFIIKINKKIKELCENS